MTIRKDKIVYVQDPDITADPKKPGASIVQAWYQSACPTGGFYAVLVNEPGVQQHFTAEARPVKPTFIDVPKPVIPPAELLEAAFPPIAEPHPAGSNVCTLRPGR